MAHPSDRPSSLLSSIFLAAALVVLPTANAQSCFRLNGTSACPAFNRSFISTNAQLTAYFPFLANVTTVQSFDTELRNYALNDYVSTKYRDTFGCSSINLRNTTDLYARYTLSYLCNAIVQNSLTPCNAPPTETQPLCAASCGQFAQSEQDIVASSELCGTPNSNVNSLLRADFTNCALPANSINGQCVEGFENEPENCGFQNNLAGLCNFCAASTINSTNSCCVTSQSQSRCRGVTLPVFNSMAPLFSSTTSPSAPTATNSNATANAVTGLPSLSGGAIAGIVIGAVVGAALLLGLIVFGCLFLRRSKGTSKGSYLNQPTPPRSGGDAIATGTRAGVTSSRSMEQKFDPIPGARVTRMTALERPSNNRSPSDVDGSPGVDEPYSGAAVAGARRGEKEGWKTPAAESDGANLSSSPDSFSTPDGNGRSEQLDRFKDYYSEDEIHQGDLVSTLWAYQPRAGDEFELERGDMLRIVGIWDDGWATGVRVNIRSEDWSPERNTQRDSGLSTQERASDSPPTNGSVKAFPLVCVCLPQHWAKIVENEVEDSISPEDAEGRR